MKKRTYIFTIIAATILAACETHVEEDNTPSPATILATIPSVNPSVASRHLPSTRGGIGVEAAKTLFTPGDRITIQHQIGTAQQTTIATLNADDEWTTPAPFYLDTRGGAPAPTATYSAGGAPTQNATTGVTTYYDNLTSTGDVNLTVTPPTVAFTFAHTNALLTVTHNSAAPTAYQHIYIYITVGTQTQKLSTAASGQCIAPAGATITRVEALMPGQTIATSITPGTTITTEAGKSYALNIITSSTTPEASITITSDPIPNWTNNPTDTNVRQTNTATTHYIYDAAGLAAFRDEVNGNLNWTLNAMQMADITLTGNWTPIADYRGTYNGNGFKIRGLKVETVNAGLFGGTGNATLVNIHLEDVYVSGNNNAGALVGRANYGTISLCSSTGTVTCTGDAGGLVGYTFNTHITRCLSTCKVSTSGNNDAGGLVGWAGNSATIVACMAGGEVTGTNNGATGGFVGHNSGGTISHCYATGKATGGTIVGGFAGYNYNSGSIYCSYTTQDSFCGVNVGGGLPNTWYTGIPGLTATPVGTVRGGDQQDVKTWDVAAGKVVTRNFLGTKIFTTAAYPMINYAYAGEQ